MGSIRITANKMEVKSFTTRKLYFSDNIMKVGRILIYEFTNRFTGCVRIIGAEAVISMEW